MTCRLLGTAGLSMGLCMLLAACGGMPSQRLPKGYAMRSAGNPLLASGRYYSADPAPLVAEGKLYILAGRDEAPSDLNDFVMRRWQMLVTDDVGSGHWRHYPTLLRPEQVFAWAAPGRAYAAQIVQGPDRRYYFYAPVAERASRNADPFAIGVAVADHPLGPWIDAHPQGPILSQSVPAANDAQNIDPTVLVDDDGRIYLYWGTFGKLYGVELQPDMVTLKGKPIQVTTLDGYFEAPWLFKRNGTYYMAYAANNAGPASDCTPTLYHACIAYGSAPTPLGPWTYRGVLLDPVSSTTSHPGIIAFRGQWYLVYHSADAKGGGHFRRSVAIDRLQWDDRVRPARIGKVVQTRQSASPPLPVQRNVARLAYASASNSLAMPLQYWIAALNDGVVKRNPLPPQMWGSWTPDNPPQQWIQYSWAQPVTLDRSRLLFWADHPAGAHEGVAPPARWQLQVRLHGQWRDLPMHGAVRGKPFRFESAVFAPVTTRCLRALLDASGDGSRYAGIAVQEWEVWAVHAQQLPLARVADAGRCDAP